MENISFVILTKNEEKNLERCLSSIKDLADEIILLDEFSTDKTQDIAKKFGAKIIQNKNSKNFGEARNLGIEKAKNEWVFFVDADEELRQTQNSKLEIRNETTKAFRIKRHDFMWGKKIEHGENGAWNEIRLLKKGSGGKWTGKVHEVFNLHDIGSEPLASQSESQPVTTNKIYLKHYPHQTIAEFLEEINVYSDIRANELFEQGKKGSVWQIAIYPFGKFVVDYIFLLGFLDGVQGFVIAAMMSFYSFLVRSKLYMLNNTSSHNAKLI